MRVFIGNILLFLINICNLALLLRVLFSWITISPNKFTYYLNLFTNPIINFFKKKFPLRIGILDLSILIPFFILAFFNKLVVDLFIYDKASRPVFYIMELAFFIIQGTISTICSIIFIIVLVYLLILLLSRRVYSPILYSIKSWLDPVLIKMQNILNIHNNNCDVICLLIILIAIITVSFLSIGLLNLILSWLRSIILI